MAEKVNRDGFPKTGNFPSFLKMYTSLDSTRRKNVFICPTDTPGIFNYCVFPAPVSIPAEHQRFIKIAEAVAEIMNDANGSLFPQRQP